MTAAPTGTEPVRETESFDTIVVGGGQAGLVVAYELRERNVDFVVLDASERAGDAWRNRWDSLLLFTPARMNGLPGMPFPGKPGRYVTKDEFGDFLDEYERVNDFPIRRNTRVDRLSREGEIFVVEAGDRRFEAHNVIVAMADLQYPKVPGFAPDLDPNIVQLHSAHYKNPSQLQDGPVLVVGAGNSGAEIALELSRAHDTYLSGKESGHVPFRLETWFGLHIGTRLVGFGAIKVLNTSTPIGRVARPKMLQKAAPLVRVKPKDLAAAGVERVPRVAGIENGVPVLENGRVLDVANVVWCTGYRPGFSWIDLPVLDEKGYPIHRRGVVEDEPGLYFLGLFFLHALWSETIPGVQPDARYIADHLAARTRRAPAAIAEGTR